MNFIWTLMIKCLILAKLHIHTSKFAKQRPKLAVFKSLISHLDSIKYCTNLKAVKTTALWNEYDLYVFEHALPLVFTLR